MQTVVVGIPAFNAELYIAESIESALSQGPAVRVLVSDNASTDETARVVQDFKSDRVDLHQQPRNLGPHENFNWLLANSDCEVLSLLCADDVMLPGHLQRQVEVLEGDRRVRLVGCHMMQTSHDLTPQQLIRTAQGRWKGPLLTTLGVNLAFNFFGGPSNFVFRRRDVADLRVDTQWAWISDFDFASRLVSDGWYVNPGGIGYLYRRHPGADSEHLARADAFSNRTEWARLFVGSDGRFATTLRQLRAEVRDPEVANQLSSVWSNMSTPKRLGSHVPPILHAVRRKCAKCFVGPRLENTIEASRRLAWVRGQ